MNDSERLLGTLGFKNMNGEGAVAETFFPWDLSVDRWVLEGLPDRFASRNLYRAEGERYQDYYNDYMADPVYEYEQYLGYDGVKRMSFRIPFKSFEEKVIEETDDYILSLDTDGWQRRHHKKRKLVEHVRPVVTCEEDWEALKARALEEMRIWCTDENMEKVYGKYREDHEKGKFSVRFRASGFFWTPRELFGAEEHLYAFYDMPELMHDINRFILDIYKEYLGKIARILQPEVILFEEDLSGSTGPMISPALFDEFVGAYYKELIPLLRENGVKNVFIDTDGDFEALIPNFLKAGVDGFLPMDVNAGMDIVKVREKFPRVKFIGAFNKLEIDKGKEAIDREFARILPVIRQGGYLPGADHQVAPSASYENYLYYISRLKEMMKQAGADII